MILSPRDIQRSFWALSAGETLERPHQFSQLLRQLPAVVPGAVLFFARYPPVSPKPPEDFCPADINADTIAGHSSNIHPCR